MPIWNKMNCAVVCLGELVLDMFPAETGRWLDAVSAFIPRPGGAPANVAVAAGRLGIQSVFIGKVGDDPFGHQLAQVLAREGVDTRGLCFDPHYSTSLGFVALPDADHPEFLFYPRLGADVMLTESDLDRDLLGSAAALHLGSITLRQEPSRSAALEAVRLARQSGALDLVRRELSPGGLAR